MKIRKIPALQFGIFLCVFLVPFSSVLAQVSPPSEYKIKKLPYSSYLAPDRLTVVASFDGCKDLDRWKDILAFAKTNGIKFTFFISGVYFLADDEKEQYCDPRDPAKNGNSGVGFGGNPPDVQMRKQYVLQAIQDGHDIESHLNGHFDGSRWTEENWRREFESFNEICKFLPKPATHVRFPNLALNFHVYPIMAEFGMRTITSFDEDEYDNFNMVTITDEGRPYRFFEYPIAYERENKTKILLMDYNFFVHDQDQHLDSEKSKSEMISLYLDEADRCMKDKRPFFISHHFMNWNHAAYWEAMQAVLLEVKKKYNAEYLTVSELYDRLTVSKSN